MDLGRMYNLPRDDPKRMKMVERADGRWKVIESYLAGAECICQKMFKEKHVDSWMCPAHGYKKM